MMERFSSLVTKSRPWPVIGRTIFFTSDKNRPTRDGIYFIDFWRENLSMYRIKRDHQVRNGHVNNVEIHSGTHALVLSHNSDNHGVSNQRYDDYEAIWKNASHFDGH